MKFSIIVTVYEREYLVPRLLHCLASQTHLDWEALFYSDGPHTKAESAVRMFSQESGCPVSWMTCEQKGLFGNPLRRRGLREATGDYVCFIGHDCLLDPEFLESHNQQIEASQQPVISVVSCRYWHARDWNTGQELPIEQYRGILPPPESRPEDWGMGELDLTCIAFHAATAKRDGVFEAALDRKYAADWHSYQNCDIPTVFSQKVVCAHF